jgi:hypothetical protein
LLQQFHLLQHWRSQSQVEEVITTSKTNVNFLGQIWNSLQHIGDTKPGG